jgi:hypothetical protein
MIRSSDDFSRSMAVLQRFKIITEWPERQLPDEALALRLHMVDAGTFRALAHVGRENTNAREGTAPDPEFIK